MLSTDPLPASAPDETGSARVHAASMFATHPSSIRLVGLLSGAVFLLALVATAEARIVPQKGIGGAKIGMSQKQVRSKLGKPDRKQVLTSPIGGFDFVQLRYGRTKVSFDGVRKRSKVMAVFTKDRSERTDSGVGIGSTKKQVKKGVAKVKCKKEFGVAHCWVGAFRPGRTVTDFRLHRKHGKLRVASVGVGLVLD